MSVSIYFGTVYKKVCGRCYTQGESPYISKHLEFDLNYQQYLLFIKKLKEEFPNDFIEHSRHELFMHKRVLVVSYSENLSEEELFLPDYELAKAFRDDLISNVTKNI